MKVKEYWNIPEAGKRRRIRSIPYFALDIVVVYFIYSIDPENLFGILLVVAILIWLSLKAIGDSLRMVSRPVCRLTDDFIILDYDRNVAPWDMVTCIVGFVPWRSCS
ncbi:MAG: hypothetical protein HXS46_19870 [Theionarchaea archaeon]|nr:hypothetical protein [Theionarchaea archaeon]